jgi:hypothetical protein
MLYVGNSYIVKFPFGHTTTLTLHEVHNPSQTHEPLYTFIDYDNTKVLFSKGVCRRITFEMAVRATAPWSSKLVLEGGQMYEMYDPLDESELCV